MAIAALVAWVLTAAGGFVMLAKWVSSGGLHQQRDRTSRFPAGLVFGHLGLAAAGLVLWIAYLLLDNDRLAWIAFVVLLPVAGLGIGMFARWSAGRRRSAVGVSPSATATAGAALPAEQTLPVPVVAAHGVLAVATVVLVLLAALAG
jgi:hypothetical protein